MTESQKLDKSFKSFCLKSFQTFIACRLRQISLFLLGVYLLLEINYGLACNCQGRENGHFFSIDAHTQ